MEKVVLVKPDKEQEQQAKEYVQEFLESSSRIPGASSLEEYVNKYDDWLRRIDNHEKGIDLKEGYAPSSTYFVVREKDNKIVGMTNIRHRLTGKLLTHGGHIGYSIRPTERKKGYATELLFLVLEKYEEMGIEKVLVTCDKSNIGSVKVIQNNFGVLENELLVDDVLYQRYWIDVKFAVMSRRREK